MGLGQFYALLLSIFSIKPIESEQVQFSMDRLAESKLFSCVKKENGDISEDYFKAIVFNISKVFDSVFISPIRKLRQLYQDTDAFKSLYISCEISHRRTASITYSLDFFRIILTESDYGTSCQYHVEYL